VVKGSVDREGGAGGYFRGPQFSFVISHEKVFCMYAAKAFLLTDVDGGSREGNEGQYMYVCGVLVLFMCVYVCWASAIDKGFVVAFSSASCSSFLAARENPIIKTREQPLCRLLLLPLFPFIFFLLLLLLLLIPLLLFHFFWRSIFSAFLLFSFIASASCFQFVCYFILFGSCVSKISNRFSCRCK